SVFAAIDSAGNLCHKKAIVRTYFDMTQNSHSSHDRLQRIRGFTIGGKTWEREAVDAASTASPSTHFLFGSLFATFICFNGTHLGLGLGRTTLIKRGAPGSKAASISAIPLAELTLPESPFTICGQILSVLPFKVDGSEWVWDGKYVSFALKRKAKKKQGEPAAAEDVSLMQNLQLSVSSRLIVPITGDGRRDASISELEFVDNTIGFDSERDKTWIFPDKSILAAWYELKDRIEKDSTLHDKIPVFSAVNDGVFPYQAPPAEAYRGVVYSFSIVGTPIHEAIANRHTCRICGKVVKAQDIQTHMGHHIRKFLCDVPEDTPVKCPVAKSYPCGTCGRSMDDGQCNIRIKSNKCDSDCSSSYAFRISSASTFHETRPCTNVPIQCPFDCQQIHWKYNFPQHLKDRHPSWRSLASATFIDQVTVTQAEELALGIPASKAMLWPPPPPSKPPNTPTRGQKRAVPSSPRTPRRLHCKDNENGANKNPRIFLAFPGVNVASRAPRVTVVENDIDDVFV
ncbi:hypothetical protein R3P38DRAFT_2582278, partial [Favolaschia claudopus]